MFKYFKIILFITAISSLGPVFSRSARAIEEKDSSYYAVIETENKGKKLYVKGDIFYSNENPEKGFRLVDIKKDGIVLEDLVSKNGVIVRPGEPIPIEGREMIFEKTVESKVFGENHKKAGSRFTKNELEDFTVKSFEKRKSVLDYKEGD